MTYLFFDCETTGLPDNRNAPVNLLSNWPRIVQLAWSLRNRHGEIIASACDIVKPEGFVIPARAAAIHGITTGRALVEGRSLPFVLASFNKALSSADAVVCHHVDFDSPILGAEFLRIFDYNPLASKMHHCTKMQTAELVAIPAPRNAPYSGKYKGASLAELHRFCGFGEIENAHDASADVEATARCFFHILKTAPEVFDAAYA